MKNVIEMRLANDPFERIKNGEKTVEIRLYDEKRRAIRLGDDIIFSKLESSAERVVAKVVGLIRFDTFKSLFNSDLFDKTGSRNLSPEAAANSMYKYYTAEQERKYGVLAIEIKM